MLKMLSIVSPFASLVRACQSRHDCIWRLRADQSGNIAVLTAFMLPLLVAFGGAVIDYAAMHRQATRLQAVADAASLAAAREMTIANVDTVALLAIVKNHVAAAGRSDRKDVPIKVATSVDTQQMSVTVKLSQPTTTYFQSIIYQNLKRLNAQATARVLGTTKICALGLDQSAPGTVVLQSRARMTAADCAVFSNSSASSGIHAKNSSRLSANLTCSSGGYQGSDSSFEPRPVTDCPLTDDPLAVRPEPRVSSTCDEDKQDLVLENERRSLSPGTYCGGLTISGSSFVRFKPGVYVIKDGPLKVTGSARVDGTNVGFFLTGAMASFNFTKGTTIDLTAPEHGEMAGILFFESRSRRPTVDHKITSNNARTLLGTIYLPKSDLVIDGTAVVADMSAYTVIIARKIKLFDGPHLVLNANYGDTDIPVPDGIVNRGNHVGLVN